MNRNPRNRIMHVCLCALLFIFPFNAFGQETDEVSVAETEFFALAVDENTSVDELEILVVPLTAEELSDASAAWQTHVRNQAEEFAQINLNLQKANKENEDKLRLELSAFVATSNATLEKYRTVLEAWSKKGAAPEDLKPHLDYLSALQTSAITSVDFTTLVQSAFAWLVAFDGGMRIVLGVLGVLVAVWTMMFVARFVRRMAQRGLDRVPTLSRMLKRFLATAVFWAVFVLGILIVLALFGVNVTPLFAVFGGLSFILGFALQETLGNLASGLMIMVLKPFDTGDYIEVGGSSGFVDEMSVVSTKIRTFDNQIIVVPNSKIWGDVITNVSASDERRVDLVFGIAYSDNAAHAIAVLKELVKNHDLCLSSPRAEVFVGELGDNSVNIFCRPWSKSDDYWTVYWDLTGQAKERFDQEGISIPFPQRDVHLIPAEGV